MTLATHNRRSKTPTAPPSQISRQQAENFRLTASSSAAAYRRARIPIVVDAELLANNRRPARAARLRRRSVRDDRRLGRRLHPHPDPAAAVSARTGGDADRDQPDRGLLQRRLRVGRLRPPTADRLPQRPRLRRRRAARLDRRRARRRQRLPHRLRSRHGRRPARARGLAPPRRTGSTASAQGSSRATGTDRPVGADLRVRRADPSRCRLQRRRRLRLQLPRHRRRRHARAAARPCARLPDPPRNGDLAFRARDHRRQRRAHTRDRGQLAHGHGVRRALSLSLGVVLGAQLGARLSLRASGRLVESLLGVALLALAARLIFSAI